MLLHYVGDNIFLSDVQTGLSFGHPDQMNETEIPECTIAAEAVAQSANGVARSEQKKPVSVQILLS
ncbi:hypothetical protein D3C80_1932760 [compost metagenome]